MRLFLSNPVGFWTLLKREILRFITLPNQTILPAILSAALYIVVFGYFLGSRVAPIHGHAYIVFIFPGLLMMGVVMAAFQNATTSLFISRWEKFIEDLLVAPLSFFEMVVALALASVVRGVLTGIGIFLAGIVMLPTRLEHPGILLLSLVLASAVFGTSGLIIGLRADRWDHIAIYQNYIVMPLMFLGGVFYSTDSLPENFRWVNQANPIYYMVTATRYACFGRAEEPVGVCLLVTALLALGFFVWVLALFHRGYKLRS